MRKIAPALFALALLALATPPNSRAATSTPAQATTAAKAFTYSGWIPYWKDDDGVANTLPYLGSFKNINPFIFEVDPETGVTDKGGMDTEIWKKFMAEARAKGVKVVPSILWLNRSEQHRILSNPALRKAHIEDIYGTILIHDFDGIDIDYENKAVKTKPYFSTFIKTLSTLLHANGKLLFCTVEPRTPADSRAPQNRPPVEYSNDYAVLNKYCDEIRIMAYDQGNIDSKLNRSKGVNGTPYLPVADPDWVNKVILETKKSIAPGKIVLGIPTYGYEYELVYGEWKRVRAVNYDQVMNLAAATGMQPLRNAAGELSLARIATSSAYTDATHALRVASVNDATSISQKIALAQKHGLKGVVLFKFDGGLDQNTWNLFQ